MKYAQMKNTDCEAEGIAKLDEMAEKIRVAARPLPHAYKLELVKP
jgi:hypothetical protein